MGISMGFWELSTSHTTEPWAPPGIQLPAQLGSCVLLEADRAWSSLKMMGKTMENHGKKKRRLSFRHIWLPGFGSATRVICVASICDMYMCYHLFKKNTILASLCRRPCMQGVGKGVWTYGSNNDLLVSAPCYLQMEFQPAKSMQLQFCCQKGSCDRVLFWSGVSMHSTDVSRFHCVAKESLFTIDVGGIACQDLKSMCFICRMIK